MIQIGLELLLDALAGVADAGEVSNGGALAVLLDLVQNFQVLAHVGPARAVVTQLCWDMDQFKYWLEAIRNAGIWMPVDVGIMPILDQAATINMALSRNGCVMPRKLCEIISKNWIFPNPFDKEPFDADVARKPMSASRLRQAMWPSGEPATAMVNLSPNSLRTNFTSSVA